MKFKKPLQSLGLRQCASCFLTSAPEIGAPVVPKRMPFLNELAREKCPTNNGLRQCASSKTTGAKQLSQAECASAPVPIYIRDWCTDCRSVAPTQIGPAHYRLIPHGRFAGEALG